MAWQFNSQEAVFIQIANRLRGDILKGIYPPDSQIPSVRHLATDAAVNPNTMQKALVELEAEGLIYTERTNGKFVTEDETLIAKHKKIYADTLAKHYLDAMASIGFDREAAATYIREEQ